MLKIIEVHTNVNLLNYWQSWLNWGPLETRTRKCASRSRFKTNGCHRSLPKYGTFRNKNGTLVDTDDDDVNTTFANCGSNKHENNKARMSFWMGFRFGQVNFTLRLVFESSFKSCSHLHSTTIDHHGTPRHASQLLQKNNIL